MSNLFVKMGGVLLLFLIFNACLNPEEEANEQALTQALSQRSTECGPPEGDFCDPPKVKTIGFQYGDCFVSVKLTITVCVKNGIEEVYFEEESVEVGTTSCFIQDPNFFENVYAQAVENQMARREIPNCDDGDYALSAFHIKTSCAKKCAGFSSGETISFVWVKCGEACCITETRYCLDKDGEIERTVVSDSQFGNCDGNNTAPCIVQGMSFHCVSERCPF